MYLWKYIDSLYDLQHWRARPLNQVCFDYCVDVCSRHDTDICQYVLHLTFLVGLRLDYRFMRQEKLTFNTIIVVPKNSSNHFFCSPFAVCKANTCSINYGADFLAAVVGVGLQSTLWQRVCHHVGRGSVHYVLETSKRVDKIGSSSTCGASAFSVKFQRVFCCWITGAERPASCVSSSTLGDQWRTLIHSSDCTDHRQALGTGTKNAGASQK